jgi:hypothetical protein
MGHHAMAITPGVIHAGKKMQKNEQQAQQN